jgi:hypothetical protein
VFGGADVFRDSGGDLMLAMEQGRSGTRDPCEEQTSLVGSFCIDGFGLMVSKNIDLCIRGQFFEGFLSVLMAFHVEDIGGDGEGGNGRLIAWRMSLSGLRRWKVGVWSLIV